ncbi:MAG: carbamoyltransferase HypF, partial [Acidobacteria bacterium]
MAGKPCVVSVEMEGILQGVGLRPTVQRLAEQAGLAGWVQNRSGTVRLVVGGAPDAVSRFLDELPARLPPRARLDRMVRGTPRPWDGHELPRPFAIRPSEADPGMKVSIPADLATCPACREELFDPASRYHGYPFTTCTDCGPRYTVVDAMPYDRERTALAAFPLCAACRAEYDSPASRRFHAESIACPACGPQVALVENGRQVAERGAAIRRARRLLADGAIIAVKGLGGYLLAVDAFDREAIARLRERKRRPHKPLAVMLRSAGVLARHARVPDTARALLESPRAPIVLVTPREDADRPLPVELLAPDTGELGVMLPTTPLHMLLFEPLAGDPVPAFDALVMTSGNRRAEPIAISEHEAFERLDGIADAFVVHDRPIRLRCDDSLVALQGDAPQVWRRARGYAPEALPLEQPLARCVLAMGAEIKNAIAVGWGREIVLSPHVGDLETPEALDGLQTVVDRLPRFLGREPEAVAVDLHPDMHATRLGRALAAERGLPVVAVQHHVAHAAAGLAEHGGERLLALVFDGTGLGPDGRVWGAEAIEIARDGSWRRLATFAPVPLPGGDAAVREPRRQLVARWLAAGLDPDPSWGDRLDARDEEIGAWRIQIERGLNCPWTHAAGRLFDAFAAALGIAPRR